MSEEIFGYKYDKKFIELELLKEEMKEPVYYQVLYRHPVHTGPDRKTVEGYVSAVKTVPVDYLLTLIAELDSRGAVILNISQWKKGEALDMQENKLKKKTIEVPIEFEIGDIAWIVKDNSVECMKITRIDVKITEGKREIFYGDYVEQYNYFKHGRFEISDLFHTKEQAFAELEDRFKGLLVKAETLAKDQEKELNRGDKE